MAVDVHLTMASIFLRYFLSTLLRYSGRMSIDAYSKDECFNPALHTQTTRGVGTPCGEGFRTISSPGLSRLDLPLEAAL